MSGLQILFSSKKDVALLALDLKRVVAFMCMLFLLAGCTAVSEPTPTSESVATVSAAVLETAVFAQATVPAVDLDSELVAYYPFAGDAVDASGNGNDGTVNGATFVADRLGNEGSAIAFDGLDDYIEVPHRESSTLDLSFETTISVWLLYEPQEKANAYYSIVEKGDPERGGHSRYGLWLIGDQVEFCIQPLAVDFHHCLDSGQTLTAGAWQMITAVHDGTSLALYIDGELVNSSSHEQDGISQSPYELFMGTDLYDAAPVFMRGGLDELRVYKRPLSAVEVSQLFAQN